MNVNEVLLRLRYRFDVVPRGKGEHPPDFAYPKQVHGTEILYAREPGRVGLGDGVYTDVTGLRVGVSTADCLPVLLAFYNEGGVKGVAALHAGWRGLFARIIREGVRLPGMEDSRILAFLGPAIAIDAFEVGPEVREDLAASGLPDWERAVRRGRDDRFHIDLRALAVAELRGLGIPQDAIFSLETCTKTNPLWPSYRRDGREMMGHLWSSISYVAI